jgi:hypothetical protein
MSSSAPWHGIAASASGGAPLLLRVRWPDPRWLRVHVGGVREVAWGDARVERRRAALEPLPAGRQPEVLAVIDTLARHLEPRDLTTAPPWDTYFPVQVVRRGGGIVEGYVGVEIDMAVVTDVFGLGPGAPGGRACVETLGWLLGS